MGLVTRHWSGKHHAVVEGINLTTLLWTDSLSSLPCDCRLYEPAEEGKEQITKNDYFLAMLQTAKEREFVPRYVCFDSWYSSLANLKAVRGHGWHFLTRLKHNRLVNSDDTGNVAVKDIDISAHGREVHLKGFGFVQVFRTVAANGDVEHWAIDDLKMEDITRRDLSRQVFAIENYHRQLTLIKPQAVLRHRKSAGTERPVPKVPYFVVSARLRAPGSASVANGH